MRFVIASLIFLASTLNVYAAAGEKLSAESSFYEQASTKLVAISKDDNETITHILKDGWKEDERIIKLVADNSASLELFKKATLEISDGYIFGRPNRLSTFSEPIDYYNYTQLFKLLLLEAKLNETKGLREEAKNDYLAATRFMIHVSQQKYGIKLAMALTQFLFDSASVSLEKSFPNDEAYRNDLIKNLKKLKNNQDFFESAFREIAEDMKNTARVFEEEVKKGATFEELFKPSDTAESLDKEQNKKLTAMLDSEFFAEFYNQIDAGVDELTETAVRAAKQNNREIYKNEIKNKLSKPLNYWSPNLGKTTAEGKSAKLVLADQIANSYLYFTIDPVYSVFSESIEKYWKFYNNLDAVINRLESTAE